MISFAKLIENSAKGDAIADRPFRAYCNLDESCTTEFRDSNVHSYDTIAAYIFKTYGRG